MSHRKRNRRLRWRSVFLWHRYLGLASAVFVVMLAVTGLMLNHTKALELDSRYVRSSTWLNWYGIDISRELSGFRIDNDWLSQTDGRLYFNERFINNSDDYLVGAVAKDHEIVVALSEQLYLLTAAGVLIEKIGSASDVPVGIQSVALSGPGQLMVRTADADYVTDETYSDWRPVDYRPVISWARSEKLPVELAEAVIADVNGSMLTLERVLLDLHSGRIVGAWGIYFVDAVAVVFIVLAFLGFWTWFSRQR